MIYRLLLDGRIKRGDEATMYFEDVLDLNEAMDVWQDTHDLGRAPPIPEGYTGREYVALTRAQFMHGAPGT